MALEEKIQEAIEFMSDGEVLHIRNWRWIGGPSLTRYALNANYIIDVSPLEECLTSPSQYIRECKRYFDSHERVNIERFINVPEMFKTSKV